ncbi:hypothetical protein ECC02_010187 [Trypanosoma cruzi]|uniref:Uncharacterized protein n=1 Tax=Trypanosoma cruzi TaxID=5693 RepID=A0A7J6XR43_TRYCR|nr:hypothetical protein ECC02_010187 [Trypanosoma cruzi]
MLFEKGNKLSRVFLCRGGRKCPTRQPVTPHRAANTHSPNRRRSSGSSPLPRTVPASLLFPCDKFPRLLLSAAAFTSPSCAWMSSRFCSSVPPTVSPFSTECAPTSGVTAAPSCAMISAVGAFVSAVAGVPTDGCCVPSPCTVSPVSVSTVWPPSDEESTSTFECPSGGVPDADWSSDSLAAGEVVALDTADVDKPPLPAFSLVLNESCSVCCCPPRPDGVPVSSVAGLIASGEGVPFFTVFASLAFEIESFALSAVISLSSNGRLYSRTFVTVTDTSWTFETPFAPPSSPM